VPEPPELSEVIVAVDGPVATITMNRPEQRNPLSAGMRRDLLSAFHWSAAASGIQAVVLTGAGDRAFCAGADLGGLAAGASMLDRHLASRDFVELFLVMQELGKPIVGRINGHALAGGFGLACNCDLLVAVDSASFGTPEINVGVWPAMIQAVLSRNLPRKVLLEMVMLGERWTAQQLKEIGLINRVVPAAELNSAVAELTSGLTAKSPLVMRLGRDSFYRQQDLEFRAALQYLHTQLTLVTQTEDAQEGVRAFMEKRQPHWRGR